MIFNIDEKAVTVEHKHPHVVASSTYIPLAVTSGKGKMVTLNGAGSAAGQAIPPYFVFPEQRMSAELLPGASTGKEINESVLKPMTEHVQKQGKNGQSKSEGKQNKQQKRKAPSSPQPGPSCIENNMSDTDSELEIENSELCCKCKRFTPVELLNCIYVKFTKWGQCDLCGHWGHLIYCTPVRVLRCGDAFTCPCCKQEE